MDHEGRELFEIIARIITEHEDESGISPSWVATQAMIELDPERISVALVYVGCHLELRQIARGALRKSAKSTPLTSGQQELFPELQRRYPLPHGKDEEPVYVKLDDLDDDAIDFNIARLRAEGEAKLRHADALEAWRRLRRRAA